MASSKQVGTPLCTGDEVFISITDPDVLHQSRAAHGGRNDAPGEWVLITWDERVLAPAMNDDNTLKEMKSLRGQRVELVQTGQDGKCTVKHQSMVYTVHENCIVSTVGARNSSSSTITENSPLHVAVQNKDYRLCCRLIENGADVNALNKEHLTPIMLAAQIDCEKVFSRLVQHPDARLDIRDQQNNTLLHLAVQNNWANAVRILLDANVDVKAVNNEQFTAFHLAAQNGFDKILELFLDKHGESLVDLQKDDMFAALHLATLNNHTACLRLLIKHNADLNIRNNKTQTALHIAVSHKYMDCVKILVESKAKVDLQDEDGNSPLHNAIHLHNIHYMKKMIAKLKLQDSFRFVGKQQRSNDKPKNIAIYLVGHGASLGTLNNDGKSPLTLCQDKSLKNKLCKVQSKRCKGRKTSSLIAESQSLIGQMDDLLLTNQNLQDKILCMICRKNVANVEFNCGHCACDDCSRNINDCIMCHRRILKRNRIQ